MAASNKAPKQWQLGKEETLNTFNAWRENLIYILKLDTNFAPFLEDGFTWLKDTPTNNSRGMTDDPDTVAANARKTKEQKASTLNLLLGQIANFASVISRNQIIKNSTSLKDVWSKIREHYGFQPSGAKFLDLVSIKLTPGERPEDLYQRIVSFIDDNLLTADGNLDHHGDTVTTDEQLTPSLENVVVLLWLDRIHTGLPSLVKQKYGAELRNKTLASIKSEISQALDSLLDELRCMEDTSRVLRTNSYPSNSANNRRSVNKRLCCLCSAAKRTGADSHFLSQCKYLPEADRQRLVSNRFRSVDIGEMEENEEALEDNLFMDQPSVQRRVSTRKSPFLNCFIGQCPALVCLDTGAESSLISQRFANETDLKIDVASQSAVQADVSTPLKIVGEVKNVSLTRGPHTFILDALVTRNDFGDVIAGEPFLEENDIAIRPSRKLIVIKGKDMVPYWSANNRL